MARPSGQPELYSSSTQGPQSRLGEVAALSNVQKPTHRVKENEGTEEQDKTPETNLTETKISALSDI